MRTAPQYVEHPARIVPFEEMQRYLSENLEKEYDLEKGLGSPEPGQRFIFDFRYCSPNVGEAMEISSWKGGEDEQPSPEVVINNLIVRGVMEGAIYIVFTPASRW
ncbi:hypothetical protein SEA_SATIS_268 [Streptomyces phage Satis]|nr:hypothetical protein SEA_SATIS_268 [Streptomyces phage Satis]QBZ72154.1 hypothetical protein SEA_KRADAL_268 [Streptomyces phage Kradal]QPL14576.1 hypothetical protein SEA_EHYELIMAYOE_271 [Streptomyces phage EhyElimayoE]